MSSFRLTDFLSSASVSSLSPSVFAYHFPSSLVVIPFFPANPRVDFLTANDGDGDDDDDMQRPTANVDDGDIGAGQQQQRKLDNEDASKVSAIRPDF